jgi:hypothetical protein
MAPSPSASPTSSKTWAYYSDRRDTSLLEMIVGQPTCDPLGALNEALGHEQELYFSC